MMLGTILIVLVILYLLDALRAGSAAMAMAMALAIPASASAGSCW